MDERKSPVKNQIIKTKRISEVKNHPSKPPSNQLMHLMFQFLIGKVMTDSDNQVSDFKQNIYKQNSLKWCRGMIKSPKM